MVPHARARAGVRTPGLVRPPRDRRRAPAAVARRDALPRRRHLRRLLGVRDGAPRRRRGGRDRHPRPDAAGTGRRTRRPRWSRRSRERKRGGAGFELAREALGSRSSDASSASTTSTRRRSASFDFVYVGSLLLHLRDPVRALAAVRSVCGGEAVRRRRDRPAADAAPPPPARRDARRATGGRGGGSRTSPRSRAWPRRPGSSSPGPPRRLYMPLGDGPPAAPALAAAAAARPRGREELLDELARRPARGDRRPPRRGMSPRLSVVLSTLGNHAGLARVLDGYGAQERRAGRASRCWSSPTGPSPTRRRSRRRSASATTRCGSCAAGSRGSRRTATPAGARPRRRWSCSPTTTRSPSRGWSPSTSPGTRASPPPRWRCSATCAGRARSG